MSADDGNVSADTNDENGRQRRKIVRVMEKYDLGHLAEELQSRWTRPDGERMSLRKLASWFNARVVEQVMRTHGTDPLDGEPENLYRILTDDEVDQGTYNQAVSRLERAGIDVENLEADFITYNSLYAWLRDSDVHPPEDDTPSSEKARTRLRRLEKRGEVVAEDAIDTLRDTDAVEGPAVSPIVSFRVECEGCGHRMAMSRYIDLGGCENCTVDTRESR